MLVPAPAPLPSPNPTTSYWQIPFSKLQKHRTTPDLPVEAEYVVIGGGISGSCLAYQILDKNPGAKVLLLEARDACSGASGRNGEPRMNISLLSRHPGAHANKKDLYITAAMYNLHSFRLSHF